MKINIGFSLLIILNYHGGNLMEKLCSLVQRESALLTDFGLSKVGVLNNTQARSFCGSPAYLAPEMLRR